MSTQLHRTEHLHRLVGLGAYNEYLTLLVL